MYQENLNFWDIAIVTLIICFAAYYVYKKLFKKQNKPGCGGGSSCSSCASAVKKPKDS